VHNHPFDGEGALVGVEAPQLVGEATRYRHGFQQRLTQMEPRRNPLHRPTCPFPATRSAIKDTRISGPDPARQAGSTVRVTTQRCGAISRVRVKPRFSKAAIGPVCRNEPDNDRSSVSSG